MTTKMLAREIGVCHQAIVHWEAGTRRPKQRNAEKLRTAFHMIDPALPAIESIIAVVAEETGVSRHDILGPWQNRDAINARQLVCWLARMTTRHSYPEIGRALNRDHTTVMYSVDRVNESMTNVVGFKQKADRILRLFTSPTVPQDVKSFERQSTPKPAYKRDRLNSLEAV
jgi:chromosomal replication initiation ATPase DnaA